MMNRSALHIALLGAWISLGGCADDESEARRETTADTEGTSGSTSASGSGGSDTSSGTGGPASPTAGEGDSCPLVGMFLACTTDTGATGQAFCDDFDGQQLWGPCLTTIACMLGDTDCSGSCVLEAGVPTWEENEYSGCGSSG